jgi:hypothetical protein
MPIEDFIITVFCLIDDACKKIGGGHRLRTRGFEPKLSDSEVITMDVVGEFLGRDTDTGIWRYVKEHWFSLFPELGSRGNYAKQSANLWIIKQRIQASFAAQSGALSDTLHMADGLPMPICHFKRAGFSSIFKGIASYGYCASKSETYYGFKGNLAIGSDVIGQLSQQFHIEKVRARDLWHLTNRIGRKVLAHTVGMMVNKILGNPPLQFECLEIV